MYSVVDGMEEGTLVGHTDRVVSLAIAQPFYFRDRRSSTTDKSRSRKTLVLSGSRDQVMCLWDLESRKVLQTIRANKGPVWAVAVSILPDGTVIAVSAGDGVLKSWNAMTGLSDN